MTKHKIVRFPWLYSAITQNSHKTTHIPLCISKCLDFSEHTSISVSVWIRQAVLKLERVFNLASWGLYDTLLWFAAGSTKFPSDELGVLPHEMHRVGSVCLLGWDIGLLGPHWYSRLRWIIWIPWDRTALDHHANFGILDNMKDFRYSDYKRP